MNYMNACSPPGEYEARYYQQAPWPESTDSLSETPGTIQTELGRPESYSIGQ